MFGTLLLCGVGSLQVCWCVRAPQRLHKVVVVLVWVEWKLRGRVGKAELGTKILVCIERSCGRSPSLCEHRQCAASFV